MSRPPALALVLAPNSVHFTDLHRRERHPFRDLVLPEPDEDVDLVRRCVALCRGPPARNSDSLTLGSHYWTFKLIPSSIQLSVGLDYSQYSAITLWTNSTGFPTIETASVSNTTTTANAASFLDSRAHHRHHRSAYRD